MAYSVKNSLFVRGLSPHVTETALRETFGQFDEIERVAFRPFPNQANQFYAQIDFKTSKGVAEGSKLSGTNILGATCSVGVIDPAFAATMPGLLAQQEAAQPGSTPSPLYGSSDGQAEPVGVQAEHLKRQKEMLEDQRFRTVHIAGLDEGATSERVKKICTHFGEVASLRVEVDDKGGTFALVEFVAQGSASVCKAEKQFLVDGRVLVFSEAKTMVDDASFAEKCVHFQAPVFDALNMKTVLAMQGHLGSKLDKVRAAASEILGQPGGGDAGKEADGKKKKDKKDKKEKKEKKKEEKEKKEKEEREKKEKEEREKEEKQKEKQKEKAQGRGENGKVNGRKRLRSESPAKAQNGSKEDRQKTNSGADQIAATQKPKGDSEDESSSDDEWETIEIADDDELQVVPNTEVMVLGSSCSSSSSSSSGEEEDEDPKCSINCAWAQQRPSGRRGQHRSSARRKAAV